MHRRDLTMHTCMRGIAGSMGDPSTPATMSCSSASCTTAADKGPAVCVVTSCPAGLLDLALAWLPLSTVGCVLASASL